MAGCDNHNLGGDHNWGLKRILLGWGGFGATLGSAAALTLIANFWVGLIAAVGGYIIGVGIGYAVEWFSRLEEHSPRTITISGLILCAGKNTGYPPINDNDWTFNVSDLAVTDPTDLSVEEVRTRTVNSYPAFPSVHAGTTTPVLHCEIGSRIGDAAAVGGAIGTVAGAVAGGLIGAAIGCIVLGVFTFGLGCLIAILIGIAIGAFAGLLIGNTIGAGVGAVMDALSDFDKEGKAIGQGCMMFLTGRWVNDRGHQHNEIHDIERAVLIECGIGSHEEGLKQAAIVGTGRHPQDRDP